MGRASGLLKKSSGGTLSSCCLDNSGLRTPAGKIDFYQSKHEFGFDKIKNSGP